MNPGTLRTRIRIWDKTPSADTASGYLNPGSRLVCEARARMTFASTREIWQAMAAKSRNVVNFEIRARADIRSGMWVESGGKWYEIIALQGRDGLPPGLTLKTILREAK